MIRQTGIMKADKSDSPVWDGPLVTALHIPAKARFEQSLRPKHRESSSLSLLLGQAMVEAVEHEEEYE
jgi:hypothetical protein